MISSIKKSVNMILRTTPIMLGVILLISISLVHIPKDIYSMVFTGTLLDPIIGAFFGSIFAGSPITSYVAGGELLDSGVSLLAVTAFLVSWVSVGIIQIPAESMLLGKKFAIVRNIVAFFCSIIVAIVTVFVVNLIG